MKRALITGITGQDGSYLAELLINKGYEVHGIKRRSSSFNTGRLDQIYEDWHDETSRIFLHFADLSESSSVWKLLYDVQPDEIYNLAAQSHVRTSFDIPEYTCDITANGTLRLLEGIRHLGLKTRFYQASSSEMFGPPQRLRMKILRFIPVARTPVQNFLLTASPLIIGKATIFLLVAEFFSTMNRLVEVRRLLRARSRVRQLGSN